MFDVCTMGDGTHQYNIQVLATHASTWVHRYSSLLQWSVPLGQRGHVAMVGRIPGLWHIPRCTLHSNHRLTRDNPTHNTTSSPERPFSHYIHSHRLAAEMWTTMKNNLLGKKQHTVRGGVVCGSWRTVAVCISAQFVALVKVHFAIGLYGWDARRTPVVMQRFMVSTVVSCVSYDRSTASSKAGSPYSAI